MELNNELSRTYILNKEESAQSVAYALQEYLDRKKNMITQTMRTRNGYMVQCKGDVSAEWTKYLGMDAAVSVTLEQKDDRLTVAITTEKWAEKAGTALLGIFFQPLLITTGIGALRSMTLPADIYAFVEDYLHTVPISETPAAPEAPEVTKSAPEVVICPHCGSENRVGSVFCKNCGEKLEKEKTYCPVCGAELDGDEVFCPQCGTKLH